MWPVRALHRHCLALPQAQQARQCHTRHGTAAAMVVGLCCWEAGRTVGLGDRSRGDSCAAGAAVKDFRVTGDLSSQPRLT
eukprot:scaffold54221_cov55-Phaeocystis_antarctica.AAC.9